MKVLLALAGCAAVAVLAMIAMVLFLPRPAYDRAHPEYPLLAGRLSEAERALETARRVVFDLAVVNGGAWRTACLFGGYTHPERHMEGLGAAVDEADRARFAKIGFVEEYEAVIAFVDEARKAHFIYFENGVGIHGQHYEACVTKPNTTVTIDSWTAKGPTTPPPARGSSPAV